MRDFQIHAYKPVVLHVDFQRVDPNQKITVKIPLHFTNEETSPAAKTGVVHHAVTELEISCLPANLPSFIEVDLGNLDVGQSIHLADLKLPEGVSATSHDESQPIVTATVANVAEPAEEGAEEGADAAAPAAARPVSLRLAEGHLLLHGVLRLHPRTTDGCLSLAGARGG